MGQLASRPPALTETRSGRRKPQSNRKQPKEDDVSEGLRGSRSKTKLPIRERGSRTARAKSHSETDTRKKELHPRPRGHIKEEIQSTSRTYGISDTYQHSSGRTTSNVSKAKRRQNHQAGDLQPRNNVPSLSTKPRLLSEHDRALKPRQGKTRDCIVCTDTRSLHRFPNRPPTTQCQHGVDVCRRCLRTWIQSEFSTKLWDEINCPICSIRMQHQDIREFASSDVFQRYHAPPPCRHSHQRIVTRHTGTTDSAHAPP